MWSFIVYNPISVQTCDTCNEIFLGDIRLALQGLAEIEEHIARYNWQVAIDLLKKLPSTVGFWLHFFIVQCVS